MAVWEQLEDEECKHEQSMVRGHRSMMLAGRPKESGRRRNSSDSFECAYTRESVARSLPDFALSSPPTTCPIYILFLTHVLCNLLLSAISLQDANRLSALPVPQ